MALATQHRTTVGTSSGILMDRQRHKVMAVGSDTPAKLPVADRVVPDFGPCLCLHSLGVPIGHGSPTST